MLRCILMLLLVCFLPVAALGADAPAPVSSDPTPEETLMLEFVNRFRADPPADAERMVAHAKAHDQWLVDHVDLEMFSKEIKDLKPVPPLVFNRELIAAARGHSNYMVQNKLTHEQEKDRPGYTGKDFSERCKAAKYAGFAAAENVFRDAESVWDGHVGYVVDYGGSDPGGMQKNRGHRKILMMWNLKEIGIGIVPHSENKFSVTENFGERSPVRLAGGVVYVDLNGNGFYDIGEGLGGVTISSSDGAHTTTWASGAYALDLRSDLKITLTAELGGQSFSREEKPGKASIKFDWIMPTQMAVTLADRLISAVEAAAPADKTAAIAALYVGGRKLPIDPQHRDRIEALTKDFGADLARRQEAVRTALASGPLEKLDALITEQRQPYKGSPLDDWFNEAGKAGEVRRGLADLKAAVEAKRLSDTRRRTILATVEEISRRITIAEFREILDKQMREFAAP